MNTRIILIVLAIAAASVLIVDAVPAQVATVKAKGRALEPIFLYSEGVDTFTTVNLLTVPEKRRFVVTDLLVTNHNTSAVHSQRLIRDGIVSAHAVWSVPPGSTFGHSFGIGLWYDEGEVVSFRNGSGVGSVGATVTGYLTKMPKN